VTVILGVNDNINSAVAILRDGALLCAVQEERLSRVKNQGGIPEMALDDVLSAHGLTMEQIDRVALAGSYTSFGRWSREVVASQYQHASSPWGRLKQKMKNSIVDDLYRKYRKSSRLAQYEQRKFRSELLVTLDHHMCHASAAYYGSSMNGRQLVLTCDGSGDRLSASVCIGENGRLERIAEVHESHSVGRLYAVVTFLMGMLPHEHEYKVMGLAPYVPEDERVAEMARVFSDLFEFDPRNPLVWRRKRGVPSMFSATGFIQSLIFRWRFDLVAAGLQKFIEQHLVQWVANAIRETGIHQVAVSGGVFMNVKANKRILELPEVHSLFIFPSCGDETNSIGAAYLIHAQSRLAQNQPVNIDPLGAFYLGGGFTDDEAEQAISSYKPASKFRSRYVQDIEKLTAETIAAGHVVARAKGRMEFGARALGNRSILARPESSQVVQIINRMVKSRDFWMPFAPSVLAERAEDYYIKPKPFFSPYMIMAFDTRPETRDKFPAAQHPYDLTARPQEVTEDWNPEYYRLLKYYEELTGEGIVLNTSFNLHGHPIVYRPTEALEVFDNSGLPFLALGNWWLWKADK
jgi:carbamoyltransferase